MQKNKFEGLIGHQKPLPETPLTKAYFAKIDEWKVQHPNQQCNADVMQELWTQLDVGHLLTTPSQTTQIH